MITLNDPKLFTRSKSRRKRAQHEREGSKNAKVVYVVVKKEGALVDPIRGALFPRGRERRRACVCISLLFSIKIGAAVVQRKAKRGVQIRDTTQKKKETTTPPKRNAPPVIDDALHSRRGAAGGVSEHLLSRSGVSKKGTWCSDDDVFDAF